MREVYQLLDRPDRPLRLIRVRFSYDVRDALSFQEILHLATALNAPSSSL